MQYPFVDWHNILADKINVTIEIRIAGLKKRSKFPNRNSKFRNRVVNKIIFPINLMFRLFL